MKIETHKILCDFEIQTVPLIPSRGPNLVLINKKIKEYNFFLNKRTYQLIDVAVPADHKLIIKENETTVKCFNLAKELKKQWKMKVTVMIIIIGTLGAIPKVAGIIRNYHPNYSIKIGQNTEKSPVELRRLAVIQTPVKYHQLRLV